MRRRRAPWPHRGALCVDKVGRASHVGAASKTGVGWSDGEWRG
jgi:hypothetical protein